jgi:hypothetical protein
MKTALVLCLAAAIAVVHGAAAAHPRRLTQDIGKDRDMHIDISNKRCSAPTLLVTDSECTHSSIVHTVWQLSMLQAAVCSILVPRTII